MSRILSNLVRQIRSAAAHGAQGQTAAAPPPEPAPFDPAARGEWRWTQPQRFRPEWALTVDGTMVGVLSLKGALRVRAEARFSTGTWNISLHFPGDVLVEPAGGDGTNIRFRPGWFGGRLDRTGRDTLRWRLESFWRTHWVVATAEAIPLVHVERRRAAFAVRCESSVQLEDAARRLEDLPALLALSWYLVLRAGRNNS